MKKPKEDEYYYRTDKYFIIGHPNQINDGGLVVNLYALNFNKYQLIIIIKIK